jgi:hypothetical protein
VNKNTLYPLPLSNQSSDVLFEIAEWESLQLTDNADLIIISSTTGENLTDTYDTAYWNPGVSNSMLKLQTGYTDGGASDIVKVNAVQSSNCRNVQECHCCLPFGSFWTAVVFLEI